jgi:hypothetical protein
MLLAVFAVRAQANPCGDIPEFSPWAEVDVTFDRTYSGNYRPGEPYDYVTINPDGSGETFEDMGITLRLRLICGLLGQPPGTPIVGMPANEIVLFSSSLCFCAPKTADHDTDADGWTQISGTIAGGGCAQGLEIYVDGIFAGSVPININSTDSVLESPCFTDASDLAALAEKLGDPNAWDICFDYNESGPPTIDASDLAFFAAALGATCE